MCDCMDYETKINDFKMVFNEIMNPFNDEYKKVFIDALFDNVKVIYEEYRYNFDKISIKWEPYKYHILQPIDGYYNLLDFLLNRAISNLEKIEIMAFGGNEKSNYLEVFMDKNRYNDLANRKGNDVSQAHYKKSCYYESLHILYSKFSCNNDGFYSNDENFFRRKVELFYQKLGDKYTNVMNPNMISNVSCLKDGTISTKPFGMYDRYGNKMMDYESGVVALTECSVEMEAVVNSDLINSFDVEWIKLDDTNWQSVPNYENGYANYQMFLIQLKSLVSRDNYFSSLFFHTSDAIADFSSKYEGQIRNYSRVNNANNTTLETTYDLFSKVYSNMFYKVKSMDVYRCLSSIFINIYNDILLRVDLVDNDTLMRYKMALVVSYNEAPMVFENNKLKASGIKEMYLRQYNIVCEELDRRGIKSNKR